MRLDVLDDGGLVRTVRVVHLQGQRGIQRVVVVWEQEKPCYTTNPREKKESKKTETKKQRNARKTPRLFVACLTRRAILHRKTNRSAASLSCVGMDGCFAARCSAGNLNS